MNEAKKAAYKFLKEFKIKNVNTANIMEAIEKQGYTIVEYSRVLNTKEVEKLLTALGLEVFSKTTRAFTYAAKNHRIVFISEELSEKEKLILLAHEEGHIFLGHMSSVSGICGEDIINENDANDFAHYLLKDDLWRSMRLSVIFNKIRAIWVAVAATFCAGIVAVALYFSGANQTDTEKNRKQLGQTKNSVSKEELQKEDEYCITPTGTKYHIEGCKYIEGHELTFGSIVEFEKLGREPCRDCVN